ncbi:hypothetical protein ACQI5H_17895 [Mycobacterium heidelbergense]|uniref:hypothetical protein n=1 Tax=Mycobacterium heidelbergense TaxID=53376 RepID=UPI003CF33F51
MGHPTAENRARSRAAAIRAAAIRAAGRRAAGNRAGNRAMAMDNIRPATAGRISLAMATARLAMITRQREMTAPTLVTWTQTGLNSIWRTRSTT